MSVVYTGAPLSWKADSETVVPGDIGKVVVSANAQALKAQKKGSFTFPNVSLDKNLAYSLMLFRIFHVPPTYRCRVQTRPTNRVSI